jgi:hypothetical protein
MISLILDAHPLASVKKRTYVRPQKEADAVGDLTVRSSQAQRELDLLRGLPGVLDLSLVASRSAAAAQRGQGGKLLDDVDRFSLNALAAAVFSAAEVVEFFDSEGKSGSYPSGAMADTVEITVDAILVEQNQADVEALQTFMKQLAQKIATFAEGGEKDLAIELSPIFGRLAQFLVLRTSSAGESISHL